MISRPGSHVRLTIDRVRADRNSRDQDMVATEEPVEVHLQWEEEGRLARRSIAVTMRTPGHDFELAAGFLFSEGIVQRREDIVDISYCIDPEEPQAYNIVAVTLRPGVTFDAKRLDRHFYTTSSCGMCGKAALEALEVRGCPVLPPGPTVPRHVICGLPGTLRCAQAIFQRTGGLHAAGLFDCRGELLGLREDVGRHNALDKLIGQQLLEGRMPLEPCLLLLSGRASFELMQKALVAGIPLVAAVGAPSSLAVELARSFGMTLLGFVQSDGFNIYAGAERVAPDLQ
ncbi:MAG: formate dehydrogenase accessory sulfurtransferase FdhD [Anaerolineae bacterium]